jgi:hypothetical protein
MPSLMVPFGIDEYISHNCGGQPMKRILIVGGVIATLAVAACSANTDLSSPAPLQLSENDTLQAVSLSASDATAEDVDLMSAAEGSLDASTPSYSLIAAPQAATNGIAATVIADSTRFAFWGFSGGCAYSATTGRFTCPDVIKDGLTLSRSAAFTDATGSPMSHYNDTATVSANFQIGVAGVRPTLAGADTISRQRTMTATGLAGHETSRTWNGTGSRNDAGYALDTLKTRTYHTQDATTFANVVVKLPRSLNPWPLSGTVTRQINGSASVAKDGVARTFTVAKTVTITFNGTRFAPMSIGGVAFTLDLLTGRATRV